MSKIFEEQILPTSQKMYRYAFSIVKDKDIAYDVVQDCLEKIWKKRSFLEQVNQPEAWAMRITRNQCLDWFKTNRYQVNADEQTHLNSGIDADAQVLAGDQEDWLKRSLGTMNEKSKEVFQLRDIEGFAYQEIAEILDISIDDVKVTLHRARKSIREKMLKVNNYGIAN